jgi:hypothetical protein
MRKIHFLIALMLIFFSFFGRADEGMWLPQLLEQLNQKRMKSLGMKISATDIYSINKGSLKDAIVSFGGFCTGEVISEKGLVLTNHHCGFRSVQSHSTLDHNYIRDGFWAGNTNEELANAGLFVTFIVSIADVSEKVLNGVSDVMKENERQSRIDQNINIIRKQTKKESYQDLLIRPFFEGNRYYLFVTETYRDIRLVGAPPSAIGNFGQDTDNWVWPRHTGDFSLFRIYAGKNNKPAGYSPDNVPYKPKKSLTISLNGMNKNDFTMIFGFPGRTTEYLPSEAVEQIVTTLDPAKILIRTRALAVLNKHMRANEGVKIQYASKYAGVSNAWKKWQGEVLGLTKTAAVDMKKMREAEFLHALNQQPLLKAKYEKVLPELNQAYITIKPYALARDYYLETVSKIELFTIISKLESLQDTRLTSTGNAFSTAVAETTEWLKNFYKDFNTSVDKDQFSAMMQLYLENQEDRFVEPIARQKLEENKKDYTLWASGLYSRSLFADGKKVIDLLQNNPDELFGSLQSDEAARLLRAMAIHFNDNLLHKLDEVQPVINQLQRRYMQAQMDVLKNKTFYPDANSTLRVAYGKVDGYQPADGKYYDYYTYLDGVMEKYIPGDYEFDVPAKLLELYRKKDYGAYGKNGKMPVCFIASNHTTGGNSGSPALDANGHLVGLNFDRVWEGTMSDIYYDASICRNIMVDIRYVLFIIDKFADAGHLIKEMKVIYPAKQMTKRATRN